jgi:hypothetical protein
MSWSLKISDGDFRVDANHLSTVTAQSKLVQDFRCALLEQMGTDNLHPDFGSLIDGGITPDGTHHGGVIGEDDVEMVAMMIEAEVTRIARYIQRTQLARAKQDRFTLGRATLDPQEVLLEVNGINFEQKEDRLRVVIHLTSAINKDFDISLVINSNPSQATS